MPPLMRIIVCRESTPCKESWCSHHGASLWAWYSWDHTRHPNILSPNMSWMSSWIIVPEFWFAEMLLDACFVFVFLADEFCVTCRSGDDCLLFQLIVLQLFSSFSHLGYHEPQSMSVNLAWLNGLGTISCDFINFPPIYYWNCRALYCSVLSILCALSIHCHSWEL